MGTICSSNPRKNMDNERINRWHNEGLRNSFGCMENFASFLDKNVSDENYSKDNLKFIKLCAEILKTKILNRKKITDLLDYIQNSNVNLDISQIEKLEELSKSEQLQADEIHQHLENCSSHIQFDLKDHFDKFIDSLRK